MPPPIPREPSRLERGAWSVGLVAVWWIGALFYALVFVPTPISTRGWVLLALFAPLAVFVVDAAALSVLHGIVRVGRWLGGRIPFAVLGTVFLALTIASGIAILAWASTR